MISKSLQTMLIITLASFLFVACGKKEETPAPAQTPAAAPAPVEAAPAAGGYEPTEEERVPGITEPVAAAN